MTELTRKDPVFASYFPGSASEAPQFKVLDGHHRIYQARLYEEDVYIRIASIMGKAYHSGITWGQLKPSP